MTTAHRLISALVLILCTGGLVGSEILLPSPLLIRAAVFLLAAITGFLAVGHLVRALRRP